MTEIISISTTQTAPVEPVTLADVKQWGNIDHTDDDTLLTSIAIGARQDIEQELQLAIVETDVVINFSTTSEGETVRLWGINSVETVEVLDADDVAVDAENYKLRGEFLRLDTYGDHSVSYTAPGYAPQAIKEAIMMLAIYRYDNRGLQDKGFPEDVAHKISKYRKIWL